MTVCGVGSNSAVLTGLVCDALISTFVVADCDGFFDSDAIPPFLPRPLDILMISSLVMTPAFFAFFDRNSISLPLMSATSTQWEQIPIAFQFAQLESQPKSAPFLGVIQ